MILLNLKTNPIKIFYNIQIRTMINSRCLTTLKTAYNCLQTITNTTMLEKLHTDDHLQLDKDLGELALNPLLGTPQHKKAILGHMFNYPMNAQTMYGLSKHSSKIKTTEPVGPGSHVITELPTLEAFLNNYGSDIGEVSITSDTMPFIVEGQKQTNFDYVVSVTPAKFLDKVIGLNSNSNNIIRFHDCKDGGGILKHSTRGSLGIITFDKSGKNIQTTPYPITEKNLLAFNNKRLNSLEDYFINNGLIETFKDSLALCRKELKSSRSIFDINKNIEDILWHNIQKHPLFPRSVSFVFLQKQDFTQDINNFERRLYDTLNPQRDVFNPYTLDKKGDSKEFYKKMLNAYYNEVDKEIFNKLLHLKNSGITFNTYFNDILNSCLSEL